MNPPSYEEAVRESNRESEINTQILNLGIQMILDSQAESRARNQAQYAKKLDTQQQRIEFHQNPTYTIKDLDEAIKIVLTPKVSLKPYADLFQIPVTPSTPEGRDKFRARLQGLKKRLIRKSKNLPLPPLIAQLQDPVRNILLTKTMLVEFANQEGIYLRTDWKREEVIAAILADFLPTSNSNSNSELGSPSSSASGSKAK